MVNPELYKIDHILSQGKFTVELMDDKYKPRKNYLFSAYMDGGDRQDVKSGDSGHKLTASVSAAYKNNTGYLNISMFAMVKYIYSYP
jgi:hypothetical protein